MRQHGTFDSRRTIFCGLQRRLRSRSWRQISTMCEKLHLKCGNPKPAPSEWLCSVVVVVARGRPGYNEVEWFSDSQREAERVLLW